MGDTESPTVLVQRLHQVRVQHGMTIQQMAGACDLPKSTLESYMKSRGARRPGIDALIAIAEAMGVSVDWLVGLSSSRNSSEAENHALAVAAYDAALHLLRELDKAQRQSDTPVFQDGSVAGRAIEHQALLTTLDFVSRAGLFDAGASHGGSDFRSLDALVQAVQGKKQETS